VGNAIILELISVNVSYPNPTLYTQNVTVNYTIPSGAYNCILYVYAQDFSAFPMYVDTIVCGSSSHTMEIESCIKYRFQLICSWDDSCTEMPSNSFMLDSCWHADSCRRIYYPILLPEFVVMPAFLNCGYVKPCITCNVLDSLTELFHAIYPDYSSTPYLIQPALRMIRQNRIVFGQDSLITKQDFLRMQLIIW